MAKAGSASAGHIVPMPPTDLARSELLCNVSSGAQAVFGTTVNVKKKRPKASVLGTESGGKACWPNTRQRDTMTHLPGEPGYNFQPRHSRQHDPQMFFYQGWKKSAGRQGSQKAEEQRGPTAEPIPLAPQGPPPVPGEWLQPIDPHSLLAAFGALGCRH